MTRWTEEEARAYGLIRDADGDWHFWPDPTTSDIKSRDSNEMSKSQPLVRGEREEQNKDKEAVSGSYEISIVSYSRRATDPDNICPKVFIDELVKEGHLPDDSSKYVTKVEKRVVKSSREEEKTVIEIWQNL